MQTTSPEAVERPAWLACLTSLTSLTSMPLRPGRSARRVALAASLVLGVGLTAWTTPARAQVTDAERAAARDLFKQGDELQRAGKFAEALDKFMRAQQVVQAPTNVLRIAECQAAGGQLVEASESYRTVIRWTLPAGAPPAFQSAVDQARGELAQVEPRVPRLRVVVRPGPAAAGTAGTATAPAGAVKAQSLVIDGTAMAAALLDEPIPLDPGEHKVQVTAPGQSSGVLSLTLRERDNRVLEVELKPSADGAGAAPLPGPAASAGSPAATPSTAAPPAPPAYGTTTSSNEPAVPPPFEPPPGSGARKPSKTGLLLGGHLGLSIPTGNVPLATGGAFSQSSAALGDVSGPGLALGLDGSLRFLRHFTVGLTLEYAALGNARNAASVNGSGTVSSNTAAVGLVGGFIINPDALSGVFELGLQSRWYRFWGPNAGTATQQYTSGEIMLGAGLWIPTGRAVRIVPLATVGLGTFAPPDVGGNAQTSGGGTQGHAFWMLGVEGLYNLEL